MSEKTDWLGRIKEYCAVTWTVRNSNDVTYDRMEWLRSAFMNVARAMETKVHGEGERSWLYLKDAAHDLALALGPEWKVDNIHEPDPNGTEMEDLCNIMGNLMWCNKRSPKGYSGIEKVNDHWIANTLALILSMIEKEDIKIQFYKEGEH